MQHRKRTQSISFVSILNDLIENQSLSQHNNLERTFNCHLFALSTFVEVMSAVSCVSGSVTISAHGVHGNFLKKKATIVRLWRS